MKNDLIVVNCPDLLLFYFIKTRRTSLSSDSFISFFPEIRTNISKWKNYILLIRMVYLHFFSFLSPPSSKLAEGIKRGERKRVSLRVFPMIFQLSFYLPAPDRNPFLARDPHKKKRTLWSGIPRSILSDTRPFLLLFLLTFLAQFLFSCYRRRYDLLPNDRVSVIHVDRITLPIIYFLLQLFHVRIITILSNIESQQL